MMYDKTNFVIRNITHTDGIKRTDGRYPKRIGSTVEIAGDILPGHSMVLRYIKDAAGNEKRGMLVTSIVTGVGTEYDEDRVIARIETLNSIYFLEAINYLESTIGEEHVE